MVEVQLSRSAQKDLLRIPKDKQKIISKKLLILKDDPFCGKLLSGKLKGTFSIKIWPYRAIYDFDQKNKIVTIHKIQHRQGIYK